MLAPYCEREAAEPIVLELGLKAKKLWRDAYPGIVANGTLVVAGVRDLPELKRYARMTDGYKAVGGEEIGQLEPDLANRFPSGLYFADEAHMAPLEAMRFLVSELRRMGAKLWFGVPADEALPGGLVIDARGLAARDMLPTLRGVRGERILVRSREVRLQRPVRLLHPRHPLYVVPWADGVYMVGATVIESEDPSPMTLRSALELLGLAYALSPAFGEAEITELRRGAQASISRQYSQGGRHARPGAHQRCLPAWLSAGSGACQNGCRLPGDGRPISWHRGRRVEAFGPGLGARWLEQRFHASRSGPNVLALTYRSRYVRPAH